MAPAVPRRAEETSAGLWAGASWRQGRVGLGAREELGAEGAVRRWGGLPGEAAEAPSLGRFGDVRTRSWGTRLGGGMDSVVLMAGLGGPEGLLRPKRLCGSVIPWCFPRRLSWPDTDYCLKLPSGVGVRHTAGALWVSLDIGR